MMTDAIQAAMGKVTSESLDRMFADILHRADYD